VRACASLEQMCRPARASDGRVLARGVPHAHLAPVDQSRLQLPARYHREDAASSSAYNASSGESTAPACTSPLRISFTPGREGHFFRICTANVHETSVWIPQSAGCEAELSTQNEKRAMESSYLWLHLHPDAAVSLVVGNGSARATATRCNLQEVTGF